MKKIVCIGDSITYGYTLHPRDSYPSILQMLLQEKYQVYNLGITGIGAQDYRYTQEYAVSKKLQADIVVLMLGSNDSSMFTTKDKFKQAYKDLLHTYTNSRILLCTCCTPYYIDGNHFLHYDVQEDKLSIINEIIKEIGNELQLTVIDIQALTNHHEEWFLLDGIHPNKEGSYCIAREIYSYIK